MAVLPIARAPNLLLTIKARKVRLPLDRKILKLIRDLKQTLKAQGDPEGVGLSAPQVGKPLKIFIIRNGGELETFINPEITWRSKRQYGQGEKKEAPFLEGCLSLPGIFGRVKRAYGLKIEYLDEFGKSHRKKYEGLQAVYIQHEYDHINGILFTKRVLEQGNELYRREGKEWIALDI